MSEQQVFRVAVLGSPQTERWLLRQAFSETRRRACAYEIESDPESWRPHLYVIDPEAENALAHWAALDPRGTVPAAFLVSVNQRAKNAVIVARPLTSGRIVDALDQLVRRFYGVSAESTLRPYKVTAGKILVPALA